MKEPFTGRVVASGGAGAAAATVALAALALRRPLARVPENTLKLSVGVLIVSLVMIVALRARPRASLRAEELTAGQVNLP